MGTSEQKLPEDVAQESGRDAQGGRRDLPRQGVVPQALTPRPAGLETVYEVPIPRGEGLLVDFRKMQTYSLQNGHVRPCSRGEGNIRWYSVSNEEDRQEMFSTLDFKKYDLESSLDPDELSRIEFDEDATILIFKQPRRAIVKDGIRFEVSSVGIFLEPDRLTFVTAGDPIEFGPKPLHHDVDLKGVVLRFLYRTVHHFLDHLKVIKMITSEIQAKIDSSMANVYLVQMFSLAESLIYYRNSIESNEGLLTRMQAAATKLKLTDRQSEYLSDILIENRQSIRQAAIYTEVVSGMMDARSNIVNNSVSTLLKKLTLINVIFLPLNLLAGIGGMSEYSAMTEGIPKWASFSLFCLAMCALGWLGWVLLVRFFDKPSG
jgi:magnesium transporter